MSNICCRIFKEQINLLKSLPNQEEAKTVLYQAVMSAYNQFENQNENQIDYQNENQNECAYISISLLSINILNLLKKNIVFKEYSSNCGGRREGSGRPKTEKEPTLEKKEMFRKPTLEEVKLYCEERANGVDAEKWINYYSSNGWKVGKNPMKDWKAAVRTWERKEKPKKSEETIFIDENMRIDEDMPEFKDMTFDACCRASEWLLNNMYCQRLPKNKFIEIVRKFK